MEKQMIQIPYVLDYNLFEMIDYKAAEELLTEYNDFMVFNRTQVRDLGVPASDVLRPLPDETAEDAYKRAEHNKQVALNHFEKLFGNKDIPESSLVGLKIDYDAVQKVLLDERANRIPITDSAFNQIAPTIRAAASTLLIAEHVVGALVKLAEKAKEKDREKCELAIEFAKEGFELLLDDVSKGSLQIPEYDSIRKDLNKFKTADAIIAFCEKLFFANRDS